MALDVGEKRIGVAVSDPLSILASPLTTLERVETEQDITAILNVARQNQVAQIIVGLPLSLNGSIGRQAEKVQAFAEELRARSEVPVVLRDERFTTVTAKRLLREAGKKGAGDDAAAAAIILQGYLEEAR
ncbi:Holliday junction resolvase RuvX [Chloroflexota bacterium]